MRKLVDFSALFVLTVGLFSWLRVSGSAFVPNLGLSQRHLVTNMAPWAVSDPEQLKQLHRLVVTRHVVSPGHHLWELAKMYGTTADSIYGTNQLESTTVAVGDEFILPNKVGLFHKVKAKGQGVESLEEIAKSYMSRTTPRRTVEQLVRDIILANDLPPLYALANDLQPGDRIFIPNARTSMENFFFSNYRITSRFGWRRHPVLRVRRFHSGVDIKKPYGAKVEAVRSGVVIFAGWRDNGYGNLVILRHANGVTTRYGHLSRVKVVEGQEVKAGQTIGAVGATGLVTGPHLHFEVWKNGQAVNPQKATSLLGSGVAAKKHQKLSLYDFMLSSKK